MFSIFLFIIAAYLVGSIPTGVIVGRLQGFDPRAVGSGNIGMTNVARAGGGRAAAITFVGDILKGAIPPAVAAGGGFSPAVVAVVAIAAFIGSICSVFLGFKGGKGVSAALGIWVVISPLTLLFALAAFGIVLAVSRIMSLASIAAAITLVPAAAAMGLPRPYVLLAIAMTALVLFRHVENIGRLRRGEEPRIGAKKKRPA
ncbi:MAG TPA: glycerol-3-phosphate 1-O-acyltransferase PlsY [Candidatus Binataceae bacterium]|nr:glycerol-3-phosphate 1-O-acyltransferase PlsY [Candidatus Binataceae bacterium]